jgi:hypothetical protein
MHRQHVNGNATDTTEGTYVAGDRPDWTEVVGRLTKEEELATGIVSIA